MKLSEMYHGLMEKVAEDQIKQAEDDAYGRIMAHAFVDEIQKIAEMPNLKGVATKASEGAKNIASKVKEVAGAGSDKSKELAAKVKEHYAKRMTGFAEKSVAEKAKTVAPEAAAAVAVPAAAVAAYKAMKDKKKK